MHDPEPQLSLTFIERAWFTVDQDAWSVHFAVFMFPEFRQEHAKLWQTWAVFHAGSYLDLSRRP